MKYYDMHTHTHFSHDSVANPIEMVKSAIAKGVSGIAFTEHCDTNYMFEEHNIMECMGESIDTAKVLNEKYGGKIQVLCGIEISESFHNKPRTVEVLKNYGDKIDALLCSVHVIDWKKHPEPISAYKFNEFSDAEVKTMTDMYYNDIMTMLDYLDGDILCHLTYPYRYINLAYSLSSYSYHDYLPQIKDILKKAISKDMAIEVNTSNLAKFSNGFYMVDKELLELYKELGGKLVTLGSDAHAPQNVGVDFENAVQTIKSAGFNEYCYFKNRNPIIVKID